MTEDTGAQTYTLKNQEVLTIRYAQKKDAPLIIDYINIVADETTFLTFPSSEFKNTVEDEADFIEEHRLRNNQVYFVAWLGQEVAGILNVHASHKSRLRHIGEFGITVRKKHWYKGIGSLLIKRMLDWAFDSQIIRKLNLKVQTDNTHAVDLYKKFGFVIEGQIVRDACINGVFYDTYAMGRLID